MVEPVERELPEIRVVSAVTPLDVAVLIERGGARDVGGGKKRTFPVLMGSCHSVELHRIGECDGHVEALPGQ